MPQSLRKTGPIPVFDENTPEDEIAEFVDAVKRSPERKNSLVELLPERTPLYVNRSANETIRIRGYILAAFEQVGLPEAALPYVLEELDNGRDAYLVAAAAKALRGLDEPASDLTPFLFKAVENIKYVDDSLTFESYKPRWPITNYTTALAEIFKTFGWMGSHAGGALPDLEALFEGRRHGFSDQIRAEVGSAIERIRSDESGVDADCCGVPTRLSSLAKRVESARRNSGLVTKVEFEDQDGNTLRYTDFFSRAPSVVVFFYTRCDNPNKCSLTVTKLAALQQAIIEAGLEGKLKTAAITYDPEYDLPPRLKAYGENRGVAFGPHNRFLRARAGFKELQDYYSLGVNFINSIVNRHRVELFILDDMGRVAVTFSRLQWDVQEVLDNAKKLLRACGDSQETYPQHRDTPESAFGRTVSTTVLSMVPPLVVAFFPKCPVCWAAYLSVFGISGLQSMPYSPWLLTVFILLMLINLIAVFKRSKQRAAMGPFYLSISGAFFVLLLSMRFEIPYTSYLGIAMIFAGSLLGSLPLETSFKLRSFLSGMQNRFGNLLKRKTPA